MYRPTFPYTYASLEKVLVAAGPDGQLVGEWTNLCLCYDQDGIAFRSYNYPILKVLPDDTLIIQSFVAGPDTYEHSKILRLMDIVNAGYSGGWTVFLGTSDKTYTLPQGELLYLGGYQDVLERIEYKLKVALLNNNPEYQSQLYLSITDGRCEKLAVRSLVLREEVLELIKEDAAEFGGSAILDFDFSSLSQHERTALCVVRE